MIKLRRINNNFVFPPVPDINSIACPPLNPIGRGYLICSRLATSKLWRDRRKVPNRPGTRCFLKCPRGYQLRDEYELTCRSDGTWDGSENGRCIREYGIFSIKDVSSRDFNEKYTLAVLPFLFSILFKSYIDIWIRHTFIREYRYINFQ